MRGKDIIEGVKIEKHGPNTTAWPQLLTRVRVERSANVAQVTIKHSPSPHGECGRSLYTQVDLSKTGGIKKVEHNVGDSRWPLRTEDIEACCGILQNLKEHLLKFTIAVRDSKMRWVHGRPVPIPEP